MAEYEVKIKFTSDRPLTEEDRDLLCMTLFVMVDEPVDAEGEHAEWTCVPGPDGIHSSAEVTLNEVVPLTDEQMLARARAMAT